MDRCNAHICTHAHNGSKARTAEEALLVKTFGADRAGEGFAVKASAMYGRFTYVKSRGQLVGGRIAPPALGRVVEARYYCALYLSLSLSR